MLSVMNDLPDAQQQPPVSPAHSTGTITRRFSKGFQSCLKGTRDDFDVDIDQGKRPSPRGTVTVVTAVGHWSGDY